MESILGQQWKIRLAHGLIASLISSALTLVWNPPSIAMPSDPAPSYTTHAGVGALFHVHAGFSTYTGEHLSIDFMLDRPDRHQTVAHGTAASEIQALKHQCQAAPSCGQQAFDRKLADYYRSRQLRLETGPVRRLLVDVPAVVRQQHKQLRPAARAIRAVAQHKGKDRDWAVDAAIAMVQTSLRYQRPPRMENGRDTLGFLPPLSALERGYGDCDTKSALLAALILNIKPGRIIGLQLPNHYLLGIERHPRTGQASIRYQGRDFVLVEASGPAMRAPGQISPQSRKGLLRKDRVQIHHIRI